LTPGNDLKMRFGANRLSGFFNKSIPAQIKTGIDQYRYGRCCTLLLFWCM